MAKVKTISTKAVQAPAATALVYCPICTHNVPANVTMVVNAVRRRVPKVIPGQKCSRCSSPLDAAYVIRMDAAA
jgi:hypothetical protein